MSMKLPPLIKLLFQAIGPQTVRSFNQACQTPRKTQEKLLNYMVSSNAQSKFGKKYHFDQIRSFKDFQKHVPISTYEDLFPYIEASLNGESAQLTAQSPVFYATTSGTTGKPKYIPVTPDSKKAKSQLLRVWFSKLFMDHPRIFDGKTVAVVSPEIEGYSPGGVPCGAESGHGYRTMPNSTKSAYCAPYEVYAMEDYDAKYYVLLRLAAQASVSFMYTVNPSTILLLAQRMTQYAEEIIPDIHNGTLSEKYSIPKEMKALLKTSMGADPKRAKELEQALKKGNGQLLPKHIWPQMAAIGCWKGGSVGIYTSKFDQYFKEGTPVRDVGYYASEHRGSVPISDEDSSGVLAIPTNFYEFYPARKEGKPGPQDLLQAHELEKGQQYYVYVTTLSGLYRYDMNDIIEVTGYHEETPLIRFVQKGKGVVSFTGEKLYESQVLEAVNKVLATYQEETEFIAAIGEVQNDVPRYVFLTEFENPPGEQQGREIANRIEKELSTINIEYASKRKSDRISPLVLRVIKNGEYDRYRKREVEGGKNDGQFKILKLTKDTKFGEEFSSEMDILATH